MTAYGGSVDSINSFIRLVVAEGRHEHRDARAVLQRKGREFYNGTGVPAVKGRSRETRHGN